MVGILVIFPVVGVTLGNDMVSTTPAEVPIHNKSLQLSRDVTRRQAALC